METKVAKAAGPTKCSPRGGRGCSSSAVGTSAFAPVRWQAQKRPPVVLSGSQVHVGLINWQDLLNPIKSCRGLGGKGAGFHSHERSRDRNADVT